MARQCLSFSRLWTFCLCGFGRGCGGRESVGAGRYADFFGVAAAVHLKELVAHDGYRYVTVMVMSRLVSIVSLMR